MNTVKIIRLTTGEEVIAFAKEKNGGYDIENPGLLLPTENGIGIAGMMPYTTMEETRTFIKESAIMFVVNPVSGLEEQYRNINSKIDLPPEKKLII